MSLVGPNAQLNAIDKCCNQSAGTQASSAAAWCGIEGEKRKVGDTERCQFALHAVHWFMLSRFAVTLLPLFDRLVGYTPLTGQTCSVHLSPRLRGRHLPTLPRVFCGLRRAHEYLFVVI